MKVYYLVASLPPVALGEPPPWTPEEFLFHCQGALDPDAWCELSLIVEGRAEEGASEFAAWWVSLDAQLRNIQARFRAGRLNIEARPYLRTHSGYDVAAGQAVTDAMTRTQPLERELALDRCRWNALEERILHDPFGLDVVMAYAVRLRLMERWARLSDEEGLKRVETFITENADQSLEHKKPGDA